MMASVDVEQEMEGLFGDTDQTQPENATQSLTQEEAEQREGGGANLDITGVDDTKKKRVMRPQPKLDPDRLMGPRGLLALEDVFKDWQPRGKGREFDDLDVVMKNMEHWAHRLFPSLPFDQVLDKIAGPLGKKKTVQCHVKKIRLGMVAPVREEDKDGEEKDEDVERYDGGGGDQEERDEFEELLRRTGGEMLPPVVQVPPRPTRGLTEEQKERIKKNRELAEKRRKERLAAASAADLIDAKPVDDKEDSAEEHEGISDAIEKVALENYGEDKDKQENIIGSGSRKELEKENCPNNENTEIMDLDEIMEEMDSDKYEEESNLDNGSSVEPEKEKSTRKETMNLDEIMEDMDDENKEESNLVSGSSAEPEKEKIASRETINLGQKIGEIDTDNDNEESNLVSGSSIEPEKGNSVSKEIMNLDEMMEEMKN